ncbi:MAG: response regulator [Bacteroidetes bacterium]|nr:response regulator [Bacteroidota bacterium]
MEEKINILLIEDNPGDARLLEVYLKESFNNVFTLLTVDYLSKGLELLEKNNFNIIILDLSLPDSNGLETFKNVYAHAPKTPIIVLTGLADESLGLNAMKLGAQDFLMKGKLKSKSLRRSINYSIERAKLLNELAEKTKTLEENTIALKKEKLKLAQAQKISHIGSWEWDLIKDEFYWSEELYRIYGLNPNTGITYDKVLEVTYPEDKQYVKSIMEESIKTHKPFHYYYRIVRSDRAIRTLDAIGEVITDQNGQVIAMTGTLQDVTDRMQEEELEKLATAATKSYNSVIIADKDGLVEWVNEGFTKLTGYTLEEVKGTHGEVLRKDSGVEPSSETNYYKLVIENKQPVSYESKNYTKSGEEYWVITTLTPVLGNDKEVKRILAIESDITRRKQIEEELVQANKIAEHSLQKGNKALDELIKAKKLLEESMRVKEQFLANMSHEIRTPMNAIVGFTDLLLKTELTQEQKQYIDAVKTSGENLIVIINDVLDFSKIQSGKISFEKINFRLSQTMSMVTELMLPKSTEKNIKLSMAIDKKIPDRLVGDPTRLNQILINLLGNAIKFTETGEVKLTVDLLSEMNDEVELKFAVQDTGIGIPKANFNSIFEEFTQATNATTRKYGGSGLGLSIVKQLVEMQGGKVMVESEVGVGSIFSFNLKYKKNIDTGLEKVNASLKEDDIPLVKGLKILLVEDNILNQVLAKKVLTNWNWNVELAENGIIALEKLKEQDFDIVLMDIQLPEMDGYEATRHIRNEFPTPKNNIPIMAMTAHAMTGEEEKCRAAGMNGYISKPFDQKVLYNRITSIINETGYKKRQNQLNTKETKNQ